jgi:hypothetical protein
LKEETVVVANLSYEIEDFHPGDYSVCAQFPTNEPGTSTDGDFPNDDYPVLAKPDGRLQFRYPMTYVWNRQEIARPFKVWFYLIRKTGQGTSTVVAKTGPVEYKSQ